MEKNTLPCINKMYKYRHLDLTNYKTNKCRSNQKHSKATCFNYHSDLTDKRRNLTTDYHSHIRCTDMECVNAHCKYAHNNFEEFYHPNNYKKVLCYFYFGKGYCKYEQFCNYGHYMEELKIEFLHLYKYDAYFFIFKFKTVLCPLIYFEHSKVNCVYSHNIQDFKRTNVNAFIPIKCTSWKYDMGNKNYKRDCTRGMLCKFAHGWKEINYHPLIYKTKKCRYTIEECKYQYKCPYYHEESEKRDVKGSFENMMIFPHFKNNNFYG